MRKWIDARVILIHGRSIESGKAFRLPKLKPLKAMRKNITSDSAKVAAVKSKASQRAIDFGVMITAAAPITGSSSIHVRSEVNITVVPLLHERDQHDDSDSQHSHSTKETCHVRLHAARFDMPQIAARCPDETRRAVHD